MSDQPHIIHVGHIASRMWNEIEDEYELDVARWNQKWGRLQPPRTRINDYLRWDAARDDELEQLKRRRDRRLKAIPTEFPLVKPTEAHIQTSKVDPFKRHSPKLSHSTTSTPHSESSTDVRPPVASPPTSLPGPEAPSQPMPKSSRVPPMSPVRGPLISPFPLRKARKPKRMPTVIETQTLPVRSARPKRPPRPDEVGLKKSQQSHRLSGSASVMSSSSSSARPRSSTTEHSKSSTSRSPDSVPTSPSSESSQWSPLQPCSPTSPMFDGRTDPIFVAGSIALSSAESPDFSCPRAGYSPCASSKTESMPVAPDSLGFTGVAAARARVFNKVLYAAQRHRAHPVSQSELKRLAEEFDRLNH